MLIHTYRYILISKLLLIIIWGLLLFYTHKQSITTNAWEPNIIYILFDLSHSMNIKDIKDTIWSQTSYITRKDAAIDYIHNLMTSINPQTEIGIIWIGNTWNHKLLIPPTKKYTSITSILTWLHSYSIDRSWEDTSYIDIQTIHETLSYTKKYSTHILTDWWHNIQNYWSIPDDNTIWYTLVTLWWTKKQVIKNSDEKLIQPTSTHSINSDWHKTLQHPSKDSYLVHTRQEIPTIRKTHTDIWSWTNTHITTNISIYLLILWILL